MINVGPLLYLELRRAARVRSTYFIRTLVVGVCLLIAAFEVLANYGQVLSPAQLSGTVMNTLSGLCGIYGLIGGAVVSADVVSREKRADTLGLLLMTRLTPMDIVFAKFFPGFQTLGGHVVAVLPLPALTILLGGVTPGDLVALLLASLNLLFFGSAVGILASTLCREAPRAVVLSLCFSTFPLLVWMLEAGGWLAATPVFGGSLFWSGLNSPAASRAFSLLLIPPGGLLDFLLRHFLIHAVAWGALLLSAAWLPYSMKGVSLWKFRGAHAASRLLVEESVPNAVSWRKTPAWLGETNPLLLAFFHRRNLSLERTAQAGMACAMAAGVVAFIVAGWKFTNGVIMGLAIIVLFQFLVKMFAALKSFRTFAEDVHSGAFEILLSTPMDPSAIVRGKLLLLKREFTVPFLWLSFPSAFLLVVGLILPSNPTTLPFGARLILGGLGLVLFLFESALQYHALVWHGAQRGIQTASTGQVAVATVNFALSLLPVQVLCSFLYGVVILGMDEFCVVACFGLGLLSVLTFLITLDCQVSGTRVLEDGMRIRVSEGR